LNDLQNKLFETIRRRAVNPKRWIDEVADVLCKSKHAIYKKIQGETCLSLDEAVTLASHYQLHLDPMIRPDCVLSFEFPFAHRIAHHTEYLTTILNQIRAVRDLPDVQIWHTGIELPFIHDHGFPDLVAFKFFIHHMTVWSHLSETPARFDPDIFRKDFRFQKLLREILVMYYQFPTLEIWNTMILDITLSQIRYALQSQLFERPEDALSLCDSLEAFILHLGRMAECGYKFIPGESGDGGSFELFHNEIAHSINVLLLKSGRGKILYLGFANPQFMYSYSEPAIDNADQWLEMLRRNATPVVRESRKERLSFFSALQKKISRTRMEVEVMLKMNEL
jgi:hypothetical protein